MHMSKKALFKFLPLLSSREVPIIILTDHSLQHFPNCRFFTELSPFGLGDPTFAWFLSLYPSPSQTPLILLVFIKVPSSAIFSLYTTGSWMASYTQGQSQGTEGKRRELPRSHLGHTKLGLGKAAVMFF